jgi:serine/threonine-protein kinase
MSGDAPVSFGPYRILERIGEGGMCQVFRVRRDDLGIDCALKVLREDARKDPRQRDLFVTEADLSLLLRHPNLVRTYDAGELEGRAYIVMELLEGGTLHELQSALAADGSALPDDLALFALAEMLAGLDALHEAKGATGRPLGIVHRDVTPHNVFLGLDGRVILGDYGVAHVQAHGGELHDGVPGKVGYLAPESLAPGPVDRRADIFSVGVLLYELLVGRRPFDGEDEASTIERIQEARPPRPRRVRPSLPERLESLILAALAKRPDDRPGSAAELRAALLDVFDPQLGSTRLLGSLMRSTRETPRALPTS